MRYIGESISLALLASLSQGESFLMAPALSVAFTRGTSSLYAKRKDKTPDKAAPKTKKQKKEEVVRGPNWKPINHFLHPVPDVFNDPIAEFAHYYGEDAVGKIPPPKEEDVLERSNRQLEKMHEQAVASAKTMEKEDLRIVYQDDQLVVIDKPVGVLTTGVRGESLPNLAQYVYDWVGPTTDDVTTPDGMVVHRLAMNMSGLIVFARTRRAVRDMNSLFARRKVQRKYDALVVGHMGEDEGYVDLKLMRCYERPPYRRVATFDHTFAIADLNPRVVGWEAIGLPKASFTNYTVLNREEFHGHPVTRVELTGKSGRTHQFNVHLAALGHPIVGDTIYGYNGDALPHGGLTVEERHELVPNPVPATEELEAAVAEAAQNTPLCVHAKYLKFPYPGTKDQMVEFTSDTTPF
eukprot:Nitzschia sp. Nitz4//scaffold22_size323478//44265//45556//NITZ4_000504-RA/size323478-augustus-gene-0.225-mRNA-1//-1//CDS//3329542926//5191//frame0